ncbi:MAG: hypothetical protein HN715_09145 [Rhodobiaceae bacterium]|jgi:hypothetical protein|nr:hypothetical protein [Rhodobiaceae bacterium]
MITEIGAFLHKGTGNKLVAQLKDDKRVLGIYVEAGRTEDLFAFREFGSASENDIVTILVETKNADRLFKLVSQKAALTEPQSGLVYQMPLHKRAS